MILCSITTSKHQTVVAAPLPPITPSVQTNGSLCTFVVQAVVCGSIIGQFSNPVRVSILNPTEGVHNSDTSRVCIMSISVLAAALSVSVVVSITVIVIVITRSYCKARTKACPELELTN